MHTNKIAAAAMAGAVIALAPAGVAVGAITTESSTVVALPDSSAKDDGDDSDTAERQIAEQRRFQDEVRERRLAQQDATP